MSLRLIECPVCGRPFVNFSYAEPHIRECQAEAQRTLNKQWAEAELRRKENIEKGRGV